MDNTLKVNDLRNALQTLPEGTSEYPVVVRDSTGKAYPVKMIRVNDVRWSTSKQTVQELVILVDA